MVVGRNGYFRWFVSSGQMMIVAYGERRDVEPANGNGISSCICLANQRPSCLMSTQIPR